MVILYSPSPCVFIYIALEAVVRTHEVMKLFMYNRVFKADRGGMYNLVVARVIYSNNIRNVKVYCDGLFSNFLLDSKGFRCLLKYE